MTRGLISVSCLEGSRSPYCVRRPAGLRTVSGTATPNWMLRCIHCVFIRRFASTVALGPSRRQAPHMSFSSNLTA